MERKKAVVHEVSFNLENFKETAASGERNSVDNMRRKSKEIRRPSVTLSREFSTTSTGSVHFT